MSNLGLGVMIEMLGGNDNAEVVSKSLNKKIKSVVVSDKKCDIKFEDDTGMTIYDSGQSCCEYRYMNCDDDLSFFVNAIFTGVELGESNEISEEYDVKESQFVKVHTNKGSFTLANYNEHNGYYGGFWIKVVENNGN